MHGVDEAKEVLRLLVMWHNWMDSKLATRVCMAWLTCVVLVRQVAGGNQVFQVVVDTDDIATQISGLLYREKVRGLPH